MQESADLLPELRDWNDGKGVSPLDWLFLGAKSDMGVAFANLFWPEFVEFEDYVFLAGFSLDAVRAWEAAGKDRKHVEAPINLIDMVALFVPNGDAWSELVERRAIYVGGILAETWGAKLARDFPSRRFVVEFSDGSESSDDDICLTFWQA